MIYRSHIYKICDFLYKSLTSHNEYYVNQNIKKKELIE